MATVGQYLDRCRAQLGKQEQPLRSNHVPGVTDQPGFWDDFWCAMNASVCCRDVGIPLWTAAVAGVIERAQRGLDGWSWGHEPRLGALMCFDFPGGGRTDHVGSGIEAIRDDGQVIDIEGNHNDRCERVVRDPVQYVIGYAYPPFDDDPAPTPPVPPQPQEEPELLIYRRSNDGTDHAGEQWLLGAGAPIYLAEGKWVDQLKSQGVKVLDADARVADQLGLKRP